MDTIYRNLQLAKTQRISDHREPGPNVSEEGAERLEELEDPDACCEMVSSKRDREATPL